ncbi:hypothetical protein JL720_14664 [Aureococcus anophagefferens]|nr:hypothetical protein JL720_14664 [Aureococcus anophagefferens]
MDPELVAKKLEYEAKKARLKELRMRLTCTICGAKPKTLLNCPAGRHSARPARRANGSGRLDAARAPSLRDLARPRRYCSTDCQRIDWRDRGHRKACKKIRADRAAEAARAEAPTPLPSPPRVV